MKNGQQYRLKTISEYHQLMGLPKPQHPLVSVINFETIKRLTGSGPISMTFDFYSIALKRNFNTALKFQYGQQTYDFDDGILFFMSPGQVFSIHTNEEYKHTGYMLLVHPDFLWNTALVKKIKQYEYFSYSVHEALFLSEKEEATITSIMQKVEQEYLSNIDKFTGEVIVAQLDLLLTYADRYYHRQFLTRKIANHQILESLEQVLSDCFNKGNMERNGLPTVQYVARELNVSPNYLSGLLKTLTGQSTQQHIHDKLIEKAKERLSTTQLTVSEIAYELGFEHSQSFSKLFKVKTRLSPLEFRQTFN